MDTSALTTIRRCTAADAPALSRLARRTFRDTFEGTCTEADMQHFLDTFYNEAAMAQELSDPHDFIFFAESGSQPVGFLRFGENPLPFPAEGARRPLELNRLYVDKAFQGKGVAQQLMEVYHRYAAEQACDLLWLGVWEHNYRAQAFYRRYGFVSTGHTHPFPIGDTPQTDEWWSMTIKN